MSNFRLLKFHFIFLSSFLKKKKTKKQIISKLRHKIHTTSFNKQKIRNNNMVAVRCTPGLVFLWTGMILGNLEYLLYVVWGLATDF